MDNIFELAVVGILIWIFVSVMRGGRWDKKRMRWEKHSPDNPYVRAGALPPAEDLRARHELEDLRARVATLERLATDPANRLEREIEALRKRDAPEA
jgi:hypothetical protein